MSHRILLVDDEPHVLEVLRVTLEDFDFELLEATTGPQALERIQGDRPDLVVLDVMLPEKDGQEVCREVKADDSTRGIPVILLTARSQAEDREAGMAAGADAYLTKPFSPLTLLSEIHHQLGLELE